MATLSLPVACLATLTLLALAMLSSCQQGTFLGTSTLTDVIVRFASIFVRSSALTHAGADGPAVI